MKRLFPGKILETLLRPIWIASLFFFGFTLAAAITEAAPAPYFGKEEGILADPIQRGTFESLQVIQFGGEYLRARRGGDQQRLLLFSWEKDFFLETPTTSFLNILMESDESRFTLEFPAAINPYVVLIAEYPSFYRFSENADRVRVNRFRGLGLGAGLMKRSEAANFRVGSELVFGELRGEVGPEKGRKMIEFIQLERDRTQKGRFDEPVKGGRLFFSAATAQFQGFESQPQEKTILLQGIQEGYWPVTKETTLGLIAHEGRDYHPGIFWRTTFGSFQEDAYNVSLPGYLYQRLAGVKYLDGEAHIRSWVTESLLLHAGYYAAGGWSGRLYTSASFGATYLLLGKIPLMVESGWGFSSAGAMELLAGTALQW